MANTKHLVALLIVGLLIVLPIITPLAQAQDNCGLHLAPHGFCVVGLVSHGAALKT